MKKLTNYGFITGANGRKIVDPDTVPGIELGYSKENSKLGPCLNIGFEIEFTCRHDCECYSIIDPKTGKPGRGLCYGQCGFFAMGSNLAIAANNYKFVKTHSEDEILSELIRIVKSNPEIKYFRHFEIGDIPFLAYIRIMCKLAEMFQDVTFWGYTKKYELVNTYFHKYGIESKPENLTIIFSHWRNRDGSYLHMENPFNFPTSEFIPIGAEHLIKNYTYVCPCSDPDHVGFCVTCDHICGKLKHGESMVLCEHSTSATYKREKELSAIRDTHKTEKDALLKKLRAENAAARKAIMKARKEGKTA